MKRRLKMCCIATLSCTAMLFAFGCSNRKDAETETSQQTEQQTEASTASEQTTEQQAVLNAVIEELEGGLIILSDEQGVSYQIDTENRVLKDEEGNEIQLADLQAGRHVRVVFDGILMRNIPATIPGVLSFQVVE